MSSFFTVPARQRQGKRKRVDGPNGLAAVKKRNTANGPPKTLKAPSRPERDESISGSESEDNDDEEGLGRGNGELDDDVGSSESGYEGETAAERRLRLAERYLENIREEVDEAGFDAEQIDKELIAERLREDVAETKGRLYRYISSEFSFADASHTTFRSDTHATTSIAACPPYIYTVSKDLTLIKWELPTPPLTPKSSNHTSSKEPDASNAGPERKPPPARRRPKQVAYVRGRKNAQSSENIGHTDQILTVAASADGKYVVTGGRDRRLIVWDATNLSPLKTFTQHREAILSLAFRRGTTNQLYSASKDRTIKLWSLNELAYVETLFGHQDEVVDIAALAQEKCVSVGARDRTARLWKVVEETQLVFRGGGGGSGKADRGGPSYAEGSIDRVALIDEETFVTGSDNGSLCLWVAHKKKPLFTIPLAHGLDPPLPPEEISAESNAGENLTVVPPPQQPRWITALATIPYADVVFSGSWDGHVRVWRVTPDKKRLEPIGVLGGGDEKNVPPVRGLINDLVVLEQEGQHASTEGEEEGEGNKGSTRLVIAAATGTEHRLGRWRKFKGRNGAVLFDLPALPPPPKKLNGHSGGTKSNLIT